MKAAIYRTYGAPDVLEYSTVETPVPGRNEILVAIRAAAVTTVDCIFRRGDQLAARAYTGLVRPARPILGGQLSGEVVAVGANVSRFRVGHSLMGSTNGFGAHAEFISLPEDAIAVRKPESVPHAEAAAFIEGALTALPFLRDGGRLKQGQEVLVNGASGSVGSAAVQIARHLGARVTGVAGSASHDWLRELGAEDVMDYSVTDFADAGTRYDVVFDAIGKSSFSHAQRALKPSGIYLSTVLGAGLLARMLWTSPGRGRKAKFMATGMRPPGEQLKDLEDLADLLGASRFSARVDRTFPLSDIADAHRYVETGHKKGNVLIEP